MRELSLNVLDIAQNSISAGAKLIEIDVTGGYGQAAPPPHCRRRLRHDQEKLKSVIDPFYTTRTTRKVGMGVPLFRMAAEMTGAASRSTPSPAKGRS